MAVNILGTVEGECDGDEATEMQLQPLVSFHNSIEPVSMDFFRKEPLEGIERIH